MGPIGVILSELVKVYKVGILSSHYGGPHYLRRKFKTIPGNGMYFCRRSLHLLATLREPSFD